ncbi:MAG: nucleoside recognition domain-containing protein [Veillonella parvula]
MLFLKLGSQDGFRCITGLCGCRQLFQRASYSHSLFLDGIIAGVGAVLSFVPLILLLFLGISFLEDTGYMARAAFVIDRVMRACGLHGKSFIPLLLGFGCSVPSVMGARILDNYKDRMVTILITPFMSCSARLPVYILFANAFFPNGWDSTLVVFSYTSWVSSSVLSLPKFSVSSYLLVKQNHL